MFFVLNIKKGMLKIAIPLILILSVGAAVLSLGVFFHSSAPPGGFGVIEIFDVNKGEVAKRVEADRETRRDAERLLKGISGIYGRLRPLPEKGYIIRIPLEPGLSVKNKWLDACGITEVEGVFVLLPEEGGPYLLIFDGRQRPWFFNTKTDAGGFTRRIFKKNGV